MKTLKILVTILLAVSATAKVFASDTLQIHQVDRDAQPIEGVPAMPTVSVPGANTDEDYQNSILTDPISQAGRAQEAVRSSGGNLAIVNQSGTDNSSNVLQDGDNNVAVQSQKGKNNDLRVEQYGKHNSSTEQQEGDFNHKVKIQNSNEKQETIIQQAPSSQSDEGQ